MSDRFHARLAEESSAWVREGIITEEQRTRIVARSGEDKTPSRFVAIMSLVGGALVASGLALVIAHNWERLTDWTKIGGLVALMFGCYAGGFELRSRGYGRTGESLLMIGAALFLCGIALVGQIYHLNSRPPNAVLLWVVAILPVAWLVRSAPVLLLGLSGTLIWIGWESTTADSLLYLGCRPRDPGASGDCEWYGLQEIGVAIGAALTALGILQRRGADGFQRVFESMGLLVTGCSLYVLGFTRNQWEWVGMPGGMSELPVTPVILWAVGAAVLLLVSVRHLPAEPRRPRLMMTAVTLASIAISAAPPVLGALGYTGLDALLTLTLLFWVVAFAAGFVWISCGVHWHRPGWIGLGLFFIGLTIVTRYFDVLGSRLNQGLFYILGGVLILTLSLFLERQRRKLLGQIDERSRT